MPTHCWGLWNAGQGRGDVAQGHGGARRDAAHQSGGAPGGVCRRCGRDFRAAALGDALVRTIHTSCVPMPRAVRNVPEWNGVRGQQCNPYEKDEHRVTVWCCSRGATSRMLTRGTEQREDCRNGKWKWGRKCNSAGSCARTLDRIQIGAELMARNAGDALDLEHTKRRNFFPLRDGLFGNPQRSSELGKPSGSFDGANYRCV